MQTIADAIAVALIDAGVETVFGLPGGEVVAVLDALRRNNIRFVLCHNESSAVFMADATARITGKPGVCLTTLGPGAVNAAAGVAHAHLDRAPVLIITAQMPDHLHAHHTHQLIDLHALFRPITKGSYQLKPQGAVDTIRQALALTQSGRPGPVHVQIDKEAAEQPAAEGASNVIDLPSIATMSDQVNLQLDAAHQLLANAKRPVIVAGLGLEPERPYDALRVFAEAANAPVITTPKGKGALPDDDQLSAGVIGLTRTDPVYEVLDEADCIIAVGFDVVELVKPWSQSAPLIWLAPWPNEAPTIAAQAEFVGDMDTVLYSLAEVAVDVDDHWGEVRVARFRQSLSNQELPSPSSARILPQTVFQTVRGQVPRDASAVVDVGSHKILGSLTWPTLEPNHFFLSNGLSCMGFALPTAIASALNRPTSPSVCFTGDAGLAMVIGELGVLAELQLPVIVVVFNDAAIDLIRSHQVKSGYPVFGTEFQVPDFTQIAKAYGIAAQRVTTEVECTDAVKAAVASGRPMLIEAMIDPVSYPTTPY